MKKGSRKFAAALLVSLLLLFSEALSARGRRGADVAISLKNGRVIAGELVAVKPDSLLLLAERDVSVELVAIRSIKVDVKSKVLRGAGCGFLAGYGATLIYCKLIDRSEGSGLSLILFVPVGVVAGVVAGALAGADKTIQLEGRSESEVRKSLDYLRGKARLRNYK